VLVQNQIAIDSVDVVLFVVDGSVEAEGGDRYIVDLLSRTKTQVVLGLNKIDQNPRIFNVDSSYTQLAPHQWADGEIGSK